MTIPELMQTLDKFGAQLLPKGDRLIVRVPKGSLPDELKAELTARKPELLILLQRPQLASIETVQCWHCGVDFAQKVNFCPSCRAVAGHLTEEEADVLIYGPGIWV